MTDTETMKAISARVRRARYFLATGHQDEAKNVLEQLAAILPQPELRHMRAAAGMGGQVAGEIIGPESA